MVGRTSRMIDESNLTPAEQAANKAIQSVFQSIRECKNFRLEAGAGAGKTYTLVEALRFVLRERGLKFLKLQQQIACITYTNVASEEITSRTDGHPAVHSSTIHAFCWLLIKAFQPYLRSNLSTIEGWPERLEEVGGIGQRRIEYDLGHRRAKPEDSAVYLGHNDVLELTVSLMEQPKFRTLMAARFPILFIDEYQDTNAAFAQSLVRHFIEPKQGPLIGLFGDSWQKIYGDGCGLVSHGNLTAIGKEANFRSTTAIVDVLNKMRPDLPQRVRNPGLIGSAVVYHSNAWNGTRRTGSHWDGDLPPDQGHKYLEMVRHRLANEGWDFSPGTTKILMLTHNILATEQNYSNLAGVFQYNDSFIKKEDPHIAFFADTLEPLCVAYLAQRYGQMFSILGTSSATILTLDNKREWTDDMNRLIELRDSKTIGDIIDYLKIARYPGLSDAVRDREAALSKASAEAVAESRSLSELGKLRAIPYKEVVFLAQFLSEHTLFSTKHGVKGAEFENVLVVLGRGWNQYNWKQFLEMHGNLIPANRVAAYERNRNLFYVACSRPKNRLALLFTQLLSPAALATLSDWFGAGAIFALTESSK